MIKIYILHAGITHPSPYFYNFCKNLDKKEFSYTINKDLPTCEPNGNGILYFNRLKRFYNSDSIQSANDFLEKLEKLKQLGWKIVWTIHNLFPIDRAISNVDYYIVEQFIKKCDLIFTLSEYMKNSIEKKYNVKVINHGMGTNQYNGVFDSNIVKNINKNNKFVFTFVGNIYKYKLLDILIYNFNKLENSLLIIAGQEPKNSNVRIQELINGNKNIIRFDGFIGDKDWKKLENITDVFINLYDLKLPAFKYGFFPSNCIQLYNIGKTCISPDSKIIKELMKDNPMIYYDYNNIDGLYNAMLYAIHNAHNLTKKTKINKNYYNWKKVIHIFSKNVRSLFNER